MTPRTGHGRTEHPAHGSGLSKAHKASALVEPSGLQFDVCVHSLGFKPADHFNAQGQGI